MSDIFLVVEKGYEYPNGFVFGVFHSYSEAKDFISKMLNDMHFYTSDDFTIIKKLEGEIVQSLQAV